MEPRKRIQIVSVQLVHESSFLFKPRRCTSPEILFKLFTPFVQSKATEHLVIACFNVRNEPLNISTVSIGNVSQTIAQPRELIQIALLSNASSIAICHNHPSNDVSPSNADLKFTQELEEACNLMRLNLLDHLIIGLDGEYHSFKEEGNL